MNEKSDGAPDMNHPHLARIDMSEKPEGATDLGFNPALPTIDPEEVL